MFASTAPAAAVVVFGFALSCESSSFIRRIGSEISQQVDVAAYRERAAGRGREALEDFSEQPELAHPGEDVETRVRSGMSSGIAKAAVLRNVGKHVSFEWRVT